MLTKIGTIVAREMRDLAKKKPCVRYSLTASGMAVLAEDAALDTGAAVQSVRQAYDGPASGQPKQEWVRGVCPTCGGPVVSNMYYVGGKGYLCVWECWNSLPEVPTCSYRKVL